MKSKKLLMKVILTFIILTTITIQAQTVCNTNSYLNSYNPNSIEYDNLLSNSIHH